MFLSLLTIIVIIGSLEGKPIIIRNISDCSITEDGILHYQEVYREIINEINFFNDLSIKAAKNYCRNPNMNINGPWCFVENEDVISMEACDVCQSLASRPTLPTNIENIEDVTIVAVDNHFFRHIRDEIQRYAAYIRQKFMELMNRMTDKMRQLGTRISNTFNFNG
ncbi:unnamed protein product [Rotaria sordida]|uniref:Kringle domain-containing protein n=1 Tax=Rotaria sordida TaxID=392033 RepID=A0A814CWW4_9BILA|nr:unnamed protein product [Rotaria sordida]CAF1046389.1 unnamed protein product [Rotaria sordida]CAF1060198.1 unnamed protein product [Rotaria sordida]